MIDFAPFCAKDDVRTYLNQPWREGDDAFASNGYMGVMVIGGATSEMPDPPEKIAGAIKRFLRAAEDCRTEIRVVIPEGDAKECLHCYGSGWLVAEQCDDCDGEGCFDHGAHSYTCLECGGEGETRRPSSSTSKGAIRCPQCHGSGHESRYLKLKAGGVTYQFQEKFLFPIKELPGSRLYVSGDNQKSARFEFDGGSGILMPCRL